MCKAAFGHEEIQSFPISLGLNNKGGMDDVEFFDYLQKSIMKLYPDAAPVKGKWVFIKCDSGPGRLNPDLLAYLRYRGFLLYPGVPNTTAVSQETEQSLVRFSQPSEQTYNSSSMREFAKMRQGLYCRGLLALWSLADAIRKQG
jgi:hypothetical protein